MDLNEGLVAALAGRYEIIREIGRGGMAVVYLAHDIKHDRSVALKVLRPELAASLGAERFLREIVITASLVHPNILALHDSGEAAGFLYYVMPYVDGPTLGQRLKREVQLPFDDVLAIARQVAGALDHAHAHGVIHRDIKPDNILLLGDQVFVGDFGLARAISSAASTPLTDLRFVVGTVPYMSPEQCTPGRAVDGRSDIYSLGCVVFEMITGVPPFRGATADATMSHHLTSDPPSLRTERRSCPSTLDDVVQRALAKAPADRFRTAGEFVRAMESPRPILLPRPVQSKSIAGVVLAAATIAIAAVAVPKLRDPSRDVAVLDTTLLVLLPLERESSGSSPVWRDDDLLHQGLASWGGVALFDQFQVADALKRRGNVATAEDAAAVASSLGAGRYVRGRITPRGDGWHVSASLYDASRGTSLYQASEFIPNDLPGAAAAFSRVASSLLLRGSSADPSASVSARARSLPAVQAFGRAQAALEDWDLAIADSALVAATTFDPDYARANLWLAQVRAWQNLNRNTWGRFAERAASSGQLDDREARLARALVHLSKGSYDAACTVYRSLVRRNDRDFLAWFGAGQCHMLNVTVVADSASPSGWRFQASAHRGMQAYGRALEILPSVYHRYERGAFQRLRSLLLLSNQQIVGYGATDSALFYARPGWIGDSLVLVPYPATVAFRGAPMPPGFDEAIRRRRNEFRRLASSWSAAFPNSAGVKQAVALSLEQLGDPTAIDTIRVARRLSRDSEYSSLLAAVEVFLLVKFGFPARADYLRAAVALGDSILATATGLAPEHARALIPVAVLLGRCDAGESLVRRAGLEVGNRSFSSQLYVDSYVLLLRSTLGCPNSAGMMSVRELAAAIDRELRSRGPRDRSLFDGLLLLRPAIQARKADTLILKRLVTTTNHGLANAALHASRGDSREAGSELQAAEREWGRVAPTADFGYATSRIWLMLADTITATRVVDAVLGALQQYEPNELQEPGRAAGFIGASILRTELAIPANDFQAQRRWGAATALLWATADPVLKIKANRLSQSAIAR